jgi:hypothetical protein
MSRVRSPNYPAIDLEQAVGLSKAVYEHAQNHFVPEDAVFKLWGLKPGSTWGRQCTAALKSFGLAETRGSGAKLQLAVTKNAAKIIAKHEDAGRLRREAALRPKIHAAVWSHFQGNLPPDESLAHYLLFDYEPPFNKAAVGKFVKELRATATFAGLASEEPEAVTDPLPREREFIPHEVAAHDPTPDTRGLAPSGELNRDVFSLPEGTVTLSWPKGLSKASFEDLKDWLHILERKIARTTSSV